MKGLFIWADSYCRSTLAFYRGLGRAFDVPLKVAVLRMENQLREKTGFSNREFSDMDLLPVPAVYGEALSLLHQHGEWHHLFCSYQKTEVYRRLLSEAGKCDYAVAIGSEAPCNMSAGAWRLLKKAYTKFVLPAKVRQQICASDFILNYSGDDTEELVQLGWPKEKIIPCGYYPPPIENSRSILRTSEHWKDFTILLTGKHEWHRSPMLLLRALHELKEQGLSPVCYITQGGPLLQEMRHFATDKGLNNVHFLGFVSLERLRDLYESCSVYVGTGNHEPWGMRLNDALQCGAPLLVNQGMGGKKMVKDLGCGLLFERNDAHSLAAQLRLLMEDKELYLNIAQYAFEAKDALNPDTKAREVTEFIKEKIPTWRYEGEESTEREHAMKILTFITSLSPEAGGPSRCVPLLACGLAEAGVEVTLLTQRTHEMNTHALEESTVHLRVLEQGFNEKEVEQLLVQERYDLIQGQGIWSPSYHRLRKLASKHRIPYITTPHGMLEPWSLAQKSWKKRLALWLYQMEDLRRSACIFTTAELEARHVRALGVNVPISVIPNGIDFGGYPCRTSDTPVKKQVLFLSRIHKKKGIELLLAAWQKIIADFPTWQLRIVGNGEPGYIKSLQGQITAMRLAESTQILPPAFGEEKVKLYNESALFVLPSYSENFGMVVAEALASGVPVITTTDTPWTLLNGRVSSMGASSPAQLGWCVDLSVENLTLALREALSMNSADLFAMGQAGSRFVATHFDYRAVAARVKELYEWILSPSHPKPDCIYESSPG